MSATKDTIIRIIDEKIKREGIDSLKKFLNESDFFTAPASMIHHGAEPEGLAMHSLSVYNILINKNKSYGLEYSDETIAIAGLFHDLCKTGFYVIKDGDKATESQVRFLTSLAGKDMSNYEITKKNASVLIDKYKRKEDVSESDITKVQYNYGVADTIPLGHGEKSIYLLQQHIKLTKEEAIAIRWHMVAFDPGIHFKYPSGYPFTQAAESTPLLAALFTSDYESDKLLHV